MTPGRAGLGDRRAGGKDGKRRVEYNNNGNNPETKINMKKSGEKNKKVTTITETETEINERKRKKKISENIELSETAQN